MNFLLLNNYHYFKGGAEKYYFELAETLLSKGHKVYFFSVRDREILPSEYSRYFAEPISFELNQSIFKKIITASKILYNFENRRKIKKFLVDYPIDLAHAHNIYHRVCPSVLDELRKRDVPTIMTLHDYKLCCPIYLLYRSGKVCNECIVKSKFMVVKYKCNRDSTILSMFHYFEAVFHNLLNIYNKNVSFFICPSMFSLKKHLEAGLPEEKLVHLPNFIKLEDYEPNYKCGDYILYVGRLSKEKGVFTLLQAIRGIDIKLKIVGDGPIREVCEKFVSENNLTNVQFLGYKSNEELKHLYRNAAFLVIPSEWYENQPMTVIESFAYGKPVIGSDIGGIPEMIINGQTGFLFKAGDVVDLREKITYLIKNDSEIENMGRKARKKAEKEYSSEIHYNKLIEIYQKALSK